MLILKIKAINYLYSFNAICKSFLLIQETSELKFSTHLADFYFKTLISHNMQGYVHLV